MRSRAIGLALGLVLSACESSSSGKAVLEFGNVSGAALAVARSGGSSAAVAVPATPLSFQMKLIAAYLSEDVDAGSQNNTGRTPMIYLNPECREDIEHCDISAGPSPDGSPVTHIPQSYFEFALPSAQVNAALNAQAREVATGTYRYVRVEFCKFNSGGANNVKWATGDVGPIEFSEPGCVVTMPITPPISIGSEETVTITLSYDLAGSAQVGDTATGTSCAGTGSTRTCFTTPRFVPSASK
jgi:hypothetical protein